MFGSYELAQLADKMGDNAILTGSATATGIMTEVAHVIPLELAMFLFGALFIVLRVCLERCWHRHRERIARERANARAKQGARVKSRVHHHLV